MDLASAPVRTVVAIGRVLRAAGVAATEGRIVEAVRALDGLDASRRDHVYWAGRLTCCGDPSDIERYDRAFAAVFGAEDQAAPGPELTPVREQLHLVPVSGDAGDGAGNADDGVTPLATAASRGELLRERDFAELTPAERQEVDRLLAQLRLPGDVRRSRRRRPSRTGRIDRALTVRALLRRGGEPARLLYARRRERPRRVVLLVDVSGSMSAYSTALLRFAHAAARRGAVPTEVFTIGTRLTRVTRELSLHDPDLALAAVGDAVPDWAGGTRLGTLLKEFIDRWGQRGTARGAVIVILSDGWERGDVALLGEQMARLRRLAHRIVWANPRKARPGYQPLARGMATALPHVDDFVAGNSIAALERLARVVSGASRAPVRHSGSSDGFDREPGNA